MRRGRLTIYKRIHGCYLIVTPSGRGFLFDGGNPGNGKQTLSFVRGYIGVSRLAGAFVSHFHEDHLGGVVDLLELTKGHIGPVYTAGVYFLPEGLGGAAAQPLQKRFDEAVTEYDINHQVVSSGYVVPDPDVTITVLTPLPEQMPGEPPVQIPGTNNAPALSVLLEWEDVRVWMTGDQPASNLQDALPLLGDSPELTVFQVPHHGDPNYINKTFMETVNPKLSLLGARPYADTTKSRLDDWGLPWVALRDGPFEVSIGPDASIDVQQNRFPEHYRYAGWMHDPVFRA